MAGQSGKSSKSITTHHPPFHPLILPYPYSSLLNVHHPFHLLILSYPYPNTTVTLTPNYLILTLPPPTLSYPYPAPSLTPLGECNDETSFR